MIYGHESIKKFPYSLNLSSICQCDQPYTLCYPLPTSRCLTVPNNPFSQSMISQGVLALDFLVLMAHS